MADHDQGGGGLCTHDSYHEHQLGGGTVDGLAAQHPVERGSLMGTGAQQNPGTSPLSPGAEPTAFEGADINNEYSPEPAPAPARRPAPKLKQGTSLSGALVLRQVNRHMGWRVPRGFWAERETTQPRRYASLVKQNRTEQNKTGSSRQHFRPAPHRCWTADARKLGGGERNRGT